MSWYDAENWYSPLQKEEAQAQAAQPPKKEKGNDPVGKMIWM